MFMLYEHPENPALKSDDASHYFMGDSVLYPLPHFKTILFSRYYICIDMEEEDQELLEASEDDERYFSSLL